MVVHGSCLCGAVAYEVRLPLAEFVHCHCSRCRKATGSACSANAYVPPEAFRWTRGAEVVKRFDLPQARSFATAFCSRCGAPLPHATRSGREIIIPAGSFDDNPGVKPSIHLHWGSRAGWTTIDDEIPRSD
jgi:hypothetical protein